MSKNLIKCIALQYFYTLNGRRRMKTEMASLEELN